MDWRPYQSCCHARALDPTVRVCPDCGHPILRCLGFADCRAILAPDDHCPVHVAPRLALRPDTGLTARVSDRVTLPLILRNASGCGSELRLIELTKLEPGREPQDVRLYWDRLPAGEERELSVDSGELQTGGRTRITLRLVVAARPATEVEQYAFSVDVPVRVEGPTATRITQHIHVEGGEFAPGAAAVVQTGPSVRESWHRGEKTSDPTLVPLALQRAEAFEIRHGIRGYAEEGFRIPRTVELVCRGFSEADAPVPGRPFQDGGRFRVGRNGRRRHDRNPEPNDLALRVYDAGGQLDRDRSFRISGTHLDLFLRDDRLMVRPLGRNGTWLNGERLEDGRAIRLSTGDRLRPLEPGGGGPELEVEMRARLGAAERIALIRR